MPDAMIDSSALDALVAGLRDGGCRYASNYPGSSSQDVFFGLGGERISANEKTAFEMAYGASLAGVRSVVSMKNVGLNACADPYLHSMITGVAGGLVAVVVDDTMATGSQEREDSRHFIDFFGGLWLEPSSPDMAYDMGYEAFALSEKYDIPVTIRLTSLFLEMSGSYTPKPARTGTRGVAGDPEKYIAYPIYWHRQWEGLKLKRERIAEFTESLYKDTAAAHKKSSGVIAVGANSPKEIAGLDEDTDILQINHYPLPAGAAANFMRGRTRLTVLEQGDAYAYEKVMLAYGSREMPFKVESRTGDSPDLPDRWKLWDHLEKLFGALQAIEPSFVVGDVGQYTVETKHAVDACLCLGSSVGVTLGVSSQLAYPYCVVGDGAYLHSNLSAVAEAASRQAKFGIIVIDNGGSAATGGQPLISDIHAADGGLAVFRADYTAVSEQDLRGILEKMRAADKLAILYITLDMKGGVRK